MREFSFLAELSLLKKQRFINEEVLKKVTHLISSGTNASFNSWPSWRARWSLCKRNQQNTINGQMWFIRF